jgi:hypothetical protein
MNHTLADQLSHRPGDYGLLPRSVLVVWLFVLVTLVWSISKKKYGDMNRLRGPKSPSWLMGKTFSYRLISVLSKIL